MSDSDREKEDSSDEADSIKLPEIAPVGVRELFFIGIGGVTLVLSAIMCLVFPIGQFILFWYIPVIPVVVSIVLGICPCITAGIGLCLLYPGVKTIGVAYLKLGLAFLKELLSEKK